MKINELMTKDVFTLNENHALALASDIMDWQRIRHIPVVNDQDELLGIVSHRDLLGAAISQIADFTSDVESAQRKAIPIKSIMKTDVTSLSPDDSIQLAAQHMREKQISCIPVVDSHKKLVGILTEADFLTLAWEKGIL